MLLERIHREEMASIKERKTFTIDILNETMGRVVSSTVLEALALELVLKVKLDQAKIEIPITHDLATLFAKLPAPEQRQVGRRYQTSRHPAMRPTIEEALAFSSDAFERWRYLHEHQYVEASMGEMQCAFNALVHGL